jgi:hypothetical protein
MPASAAPPATLVGCLDARYGVIGTSGRDVAGRVLPVTAKRCADMVASLLPLAM